VRIDQCVSAVIAVNVSVILERFSCSNDTSVTTMRVGCHQATPMILDTLCSLPYLTPAIRVRGDEVDTWPEIQGGYNHMTEVGEPYGL
jgi:hypothetical protein